MELRKRGVQPTELDYCRVIKALGQGRQYAKMMEAFRIVQANKMLSSAVFEAVIEGCKDCGKYQEASSFLDLMRESGFPPSAEAHSAILSAVASTGDKDMVLQIYNKLRNEGIIPLKTACDESLQALARDGDIAQVARLIDDMTASDVAVDARSYYFLLSACAVAEDNLKLVRVLDIMKKRKIELDVACYSLTISALGNAGEWEKALAHYMQAKELNVSPMGAVRLYLSLCSALVQSKKNREAYDYFNELLDGGYFEPLEVYDDRMTLDLSMIPAVLFETAVKAMFDRMRAEYRDFKRRQSQGGDAPQQVPPLWIVPPAGLACPDACRALRFKFGIKSLAKLDRNRELSLVLTSGEVLTWLRKGVV